MADFQLSFFSSHYRARAQVIRLAVCCDDGVRVKHREMTLHIRRKQHLSALLVLVAMEMKMMNIASTDSPKRGINNRHTSVV